MKNEPANNQQQPEKQLKSSLDFNETKTDRLAISIMNIFGSITFLICCIMFFILWMLWNLGVLPILKPFDPYPFPLLEMLVSTFAIVLSVSVIINQNRQGRIEKISSQVEFEVNVRAEEEITKMLNMLTEIQQHLGLTNEGDTDLQEMKKPTDVGQIHQTLDKKNNVKT